MAFRYKLESILRLRSSIEHQEEQRLLSIASTVARLKAEIVSLDESRIAEQRHLQEELQNGVSGSLLQFMAICDLAVDRRRNTLLRTLKECEARRLEQLTSYQKARQNREILSGLRDSQFHAYEIEFARQVQQEADESFLFRAFFSPEA